MNSLLYYKLPVLTEDTPELERFKELEDSLKEFIVIVMKMGPLHFYPGYTNNIKSIIHFYFVISLLMTDCTQVSSGERH